MKAVILARVSTEMQEDGFSLDAQLDRLRNYCSFKGLEIAKEFTFVESSFHGKRTKFYEAVNYIKRQSKLFAFALYKEGAVCLFAAYRPQELRTL